MTSSGHFGLRTFFLGESLHECPGETHHDSQWIFQACRWGAAAGVSHLRSDGLETLTERRRAMLEPALR